MAETNAFPPHRLLASRPVDPSEALRLISNYLEAAETDASLQPNALLTESGPVSATQGISIGLVLHNLKRVEAGLRGEHLNADPLNELGDNAYDLQEQVTTRKLRAVQSPAVEEGTEQAVAGSDDWQDKGEFEREQEIEQGAIEDQITAVVENATDPVNGPVVQTVLLDSDKTQRKQQRKQKRQEEKRKKKSHVDQKAKPRSEG